MSGDQILALLLGLAFFGVLWAVGIRMLGRAGGGTVAGEFSVGNLVNLKLNLQAGQQELAIDALSQAAAARGEEGVLPEVIEQVRRTSTVSVRRLLWVDDHPDNNVDETISLQLLGASVIPAVDTASALRFLDSPLVFDLVITDIGRGDDEAAGVTLVRMLQARANLPVIVYTSAGNPHWDAAAQAGAMVVTASPGELVREYLRLATA